MLQSFLNLLHLGPLDGWKTIIGILTYFGGKFGASAGDIQTVTDWAGGTMMVWGIVSRIVKNIAGAFKK